MKGNSQGGLASISELGDENIHARAWQSSPNDLLGEEAEEDIGPEEAEEIYEDIARIRPLAISEGGLEKQRGQGIPYACGGKMSEGVKMYHGYDTTNVANQLLYDCHRTGSAWCLHEALARRKAKGHALKKLVIAGSSYASNTQVEELRKVVDEVDWDGYTQASSDTGSNIDREDAF
ncbi:hypothetical protein BU15DRAFT_61029 [Melanogaster broomeanus]|nr:hypothetical protein BU15DRAFT_61029 [Melanogaster broomeanus]